MGGERRFTIQELKEYDGKEGKPAYAVFKGKVYDISNSPLWKNGIHAGKHSAGVDLTESMSSTFLVGRFCESDIIIIRNQ